MVNDLAQDSQRCGPIIIFARFFWLNQNSISFEPYTLLYYLVYKMDRQPQPARISEMSKRSRNWQFTCNWYVQECIDHILEIPTRGKIFQEEEAEPSAKNDWIPVPHLQGFLRFHSAILGSDVKLKFCKCEITDAETGAILELCDHRKEIHLEVAHHPADLVEYCRKGETRSGACWEEGDMNFAQGERNDWDAVINFIREGNHSYREVTELFPRECLQYDRAIHRMLEEEQFNSQPLWRTVRVYVLLGPAGYGKTRVCYEYDPDLYAVTSPDAGGHVWFDNYKGQKTLLLDDFYGWIQYHSLLRILDGHRLQLQTKGGHCYPRFTTVIFTVNPEGHPDLWYKHKYPAGVSPALARRINTGGICDITKIKHDTLLQILRKGQRLQPVVSGLSLATSPNFVTVTHTAPAAGGVPGTGTNTLRDARRRRDADAPETGGRLLHQPMVGPYGIPTAFGQRVEVDLTDDGPGLSQVQKELEEEIERNDRELERLLDMEIITADGETPQGSVDMS